MMFACAYYLYIDGLFSYASFVAIEVIAISTLMACLMLLDAISALKCNTKPDSKLIDANKVATGADYESEDDLPNKKILKRR